MQTIIENGTIVSDGKAKQADIVITDDRITDIIDHANANHPDCDRHIDAAGCLVIPGIIDTHVHMRDPGLTHKGDIETESQEAARGGVTTVFDMPNTVPQTTNIEELNKKLDKASRKSSVNYAFFIGATNDNIDQIANIDTQLTPGIKLFMGSSTGNMLVDRRETLQQVFQKSKLPIVAHCEDTNIIESNMKRFTQQLGGEPPIEYHPLIRSEEACWQSTSVAVELARQTGAQLHIAHISTKRELQLIRNEYPNITAEAVVAHLWFTYEDYKRKGALIKCNPAIKTNSDREELRKAIADGRITTIATDHAPHLLSEKQGGCKQAASGTPMIRYSLSAMMQLVEKKVITIEQLVALMCHNPATLFNVAERGFIRKGYKADIAIVEKQPLEVTKENLTCRCQWSPMIGEKFDWQVRDTFLNGQHIVNNHRLNTQYKGQQITFNR